MHGPALLAITDINHEDDNETLEQLLVQYEAKFMPPAASSLARTRFEEARQGSKESNLAFHGRVATLWARAYPGDPIGNLVIRKFMTGLRTLRMREFVQRANPATWAAVLQAAQAEQAIVESNKATSSEDSMDISAIDLKKTKCHGCGRFGHVVAHCRSRSSGQPNKGDPRKPNSCKKDSAPPARRQARGRPSLQEILTTEDDDAPHANECSFPEEPEDDDSSSQEEEEDDSDENTGF
ncbi:unnamed protein product [Sphagnum tenellum]